MLDKLNTDTIYDIAGKLSSSDSVHLICEIFENFEKKMKEKSSITKDEVSASALPSKDKKHKLFHGLYNWYLYTRKDSISELAKFIRSHGYNKEADIIYPYCKFTSLKSTKIFHAMYLLDYYCS